MRYYIKCKLNPENKQRLADSINSGSLARGKIFYEGMQTALREGTIDENDIVHFVEVCYCLEGGLYPMAMEIPILDEHFDIIEVKDARLRDQCTMECEFCDCTRNIKLPGKSLVNELNIKKRKDVSVEEDNNKEEGGDNNDFIDVGRIRLNRKKQKEGLESLKNVSTCNGIDHKKIKPVFAGAAISGLFAIFYDGVDYFRIKNISDNEESRQLFHEMGFGEVYSDVKSIKMTARDSLAKSDKRSNVV
ncbi:MAG: hypothetical protein JO297_08090 [Nitrososphaeraceae archaeon]|nr:hypothetical protein [Nitrososphaeraceae archaeon]